MSVTNLLEKLYTYNHQNTHGDHTNTTTLQYMRDHHTTSPQRYPNTTKQPRKGITTYKGNHYPLTLLLPLTVITMPPYKRGHYITTSLHTDDNHIATPPYTEHHHATTPTFLHHLSVVSFLEVEHCYMFCEWQVIVKLRGRTVHVKAAAGGRALAKLMGNKL